MSQEELTVPERVRVVFADQLNLPRSQYIPLDFAQKGEARFCLGTYSLTYSKAITKAPGAGLSTGLPDIFAKFDPSKLRPGWEDNTKIAIADLQVGEKDFDLCGRSALQRAIRLWRQKGLDPMIGLEAEAYIFQRDARGEWVPYDTPGAFLYGTGPFTDPEGLIDEIWASAGRCEIPVESINANFDASQFKLTLRTTDALQACDDFFLFRTMARELLYRRGYLLSFMPKPVVDKGGSGLHIKMSFDKEDGDNALALGSSPNQLSNLASGCIAGLLHHHRGLAGLIAPTVNSYDRLQPASFCGYWANWGYDHRGVAVRIPTERDGSTCIEHRLADCAANPYVTAAAALHAAYLGYENSYTLPDVQTGEGVEDVHTDICTAGNLSESLDFLEADEVLCLALGKTLVDNYVALKRAEIEELDGKSPKQIFDYYIPFV